MKQYIITEGTRDSIAIRLELDGRHADARLLRSLPELPAEETDAETMQMAYDYIMGCLAVTHDQQERDHIENILMRMAHPNRPSPAEPETDECKCGHDIGDHPHLGGCRKCVCAEFSLAEPETCENDWYCPTCRRAVSPDCVTHEETHDPRYGGCGDPVEPSRELYEATAPAEPETCEFGDYVGIEQIRYGAPNEIYTHKAIGRLRSNSYVPVPVQSPATETLHGDVSDVVACVCCGVSEREVRNYRVADVRPIKPGRK